MLYSYSGFPDRKLALLEVVPSAEQPSETTRLEPADPESPVSLGAKTPPESVSAIPVPASPTVKTPSPAASLQELPRSDLGNAVSDPTMSKSLLDGDTSQDDERQRQMRVKRNAMSGLSILLTLMSILVAFTYVPLPSQTTHVIPNGYLRRISLIEIMSLIGDNCTPCQDAANAPDGGGLAGRWWRGWAAVSTVNTLCACYTHVVVRRRMTAPATSARLSWDRSSPL